jgi:hypothetical protein
VVSVSVPEAAAAVASLVAAAEDAVESPQAVQPRTMRAANNSASALFFMTISPFSFAESVPGRRTVQLPAWTF